MTSTAASPLDRRSVLDVAGLLPAHLEAIIAARRLTGVQAALWHDGELVAEVASGTADAVADIPLETTHRLRIASHSKTFCALAVLRLAEQGRLRLEDRLGDHVPELAEAPVADRTLSDLLSHSAGLTRDGSDAAWWEMRSPFADRRTLLEQARHAVVADAGEHLQYSNIGYGLLGLVIEEATGQSFESAVTALVLDPAGPLDIGPDLPENHLGPDATDGFASGHTALVHGERRIIEQIAAGALASATGFWASAGAIATFAGRALCDAAVVSPESLRRMRRRVWTLAEGTGYGLGLQEARIHGFSVVGHSGGYPTGLTRTWAVPSSRLVVSVLGTSLDSPTSDIAAGILGLLSLATGSPAPNASGHEGPGALGGASLGRPRPVPLADQDEVDAFGEELSAASVAELVAGDYDSLWGRSRVAILGGRLFCLDAGAPDPAQTALELQVTGVREEDGAREGHRAIIVDLAPWGDSGYGAWAEPLRARIEDEGGARRCVSLWRTGHTLIPVVDAERPERVITPR